MTPAVSPRVGCCLWQPPEERGTIHTMTTSSAFNGEPAALGERTALAWQILAPLARYRRPDGYEGHLVEAAWAAWSRWGTTHGPRCGPLKAGTPECEYFLGTVVHLEGVTPKDRLTALRLRPVTPTPTSGADCWNCLRKSQAPCEPRFCGSWPPRTAPTTVRWNRPEKPGRNGLAEGRLVIVPRYLIRVFSGGVAAWFGDSARHRFSGEGVRSGGRRAFGVRGRGR